VGECMAEIRTLSLFQLATAPEDKLDSMLTRIDQGGAQALAALETSVDTHKAGSDDGAQDSRGL
jgi:hypothetical protein